MLSQKCRQYFFLEEDGPQNLAKLLLQNEDPIRILNQAGLTGQLTNKGFMVETYQFILKQLSKELETGTLQEQLLDKVINLSLETQNNIPHLRYQTAKKDLVEHMLLPFARGLANIQHKEKIKSFLLKYFGDPRFKQSGWIQVDKQAKQIILRWLVGETLNVFFQILDNSADHIWEYRKAFWETYYKKGFITDAWAILGPDAVYLAKNIENLAYGRLGGGYQRNQSVLLMRIGSLVVAEWSHNGKCRIWQDTAPYNNDTIPNFYESTTYSAHSLRTGANFEQAHHGSLNGRWQERIKNYIYQQTNIRIYHSEYMPG